ncbi:MAG: hypothetical protein K5894_09945 [Lachnospiraceae bacterium]|nr:hypothetical protein [Lachnospiraceae bacterium]
MRRSDDRHIDTLFREWIDRFQGEDFKYSTEISAESASVIDKSDLEAMEHTALKSLIKEIDKGEGYTNDVAKAVREFCYYGMKAGFFEGFKTSQDFYK